MAIFPQEKDRTLDEAVTNADENPRSGPPAGLTEKQREVLDLLIGHMTSKEMARELGISPHTVDQRLMFAREKLGARNRSELATIYRDLIATGDRSTYGFSDVDPDLVRGDIGDQGRGPTSSGAEPEVEVLPEILPAAFDGRHATVLRTASTVLIALTLLLVLLGSIALYEYVARVIG